MCPRQPLTFCKKNSMRYRAMSNIFYSLFYIYLLQKHCSIVAERELPIHPLPPEGHEPSSDSRAQHGPVSRNRPQGRSHVRANSRLHPASCSAWEHLCSLSQAAQHSCWHSITRGYAAAAPAGQLNSCELQGEAACLDVERSSPK